MEYTTKEFLDSIEIMFEDRTKLETLVANMKRKYSDTFKVNEYKNTKKMKVCWFKIKDGYT